MKTVVLIDYLGRKVRLTPERRQHIVEHHPEMKELVEKIGSVLAHPERVVRSRSDPEAELFYLWQMQTRVGSKYLCVVVLQKDDAFVLTAYLTDECKKGEIVWPRNGA